MTTVLGADLHKSPYTIAAIAAPTGEVLGGKTIHGGARGFAWFSSGLAGSAPLTLSQAGPGTPAVG